MGHEGTQRGCWQDGLGYTDQIEHHGKKRKGRKEGNEMDISVHLPCTECFSMCYFFESPQQNSEAPLRDTRCTVKVTEDHTRQGRAASPSMCTIPLIRV